ncbi:Hypothetical predicted protein [Paramuricea clavata]|uniref:Uncharacterized protein n=1 Tax=Paramuricea clavata TaxID=317549 RepID=A0A7D9E2Y0_PARCT|nr:Hypothetical predicted protein [Paramuricea clavata]
MNCGDHCNTFKVEDGVVVKRELRAMFSTDEEADFRMLFRISSVQPIANVVIRTIDTNVLVIALGCFSSLPQELDIWIETGVYTKNTLRYINVNQIFQELGQTLCLALPTYHAFTGCDYTASFRRKGKVRPLKLLEGSESAI